MKRKSSDSIVNTILELQKERNLTKRFKVLINL